MSALPRSFIASDDRSDMRPVVQGAHHMVAAGHYLAAHAGFAILEAGGNAADAGVAAGLAVGVVQSNLVNVAGVAPIILYLADRQEVATISGLGTWPAATDVAYFRRQCGGAIPEGVLRTVVPAAPDAWLTALERFGTMPFADVAEPAIRYARDGFPMHPLMSEGIARHQESYERWVSSSAVYLPLGQPPEPGEIFVQADLAASLQYMADEERAAAKHGRNAGLDAARRAFYRGDIARAIVRHHTEEGGWLSESDMSAFRVEVESSVAGRFAGANIHVCGPWCQGPALLQILDLLDPAELQTLGPANPRGVHLVVEAIKLAFADREEYYGDPRFVDVPMTELLSEDYSRARRTKIRSDSAWAEMPPPGDAYAARGLVNEHRVPRGDAAGDAPPDTSYVAVVDADGNAFSATPSDFAHDTPVIPGTGLCASSRGSQSFTAPGHASVVAPGKRPRLTPSPALALLDNGVVMPFGTPGGDVQLQAMTQALINLLVHGMSLQGAVDAPRFASYSFPQSFEPHAYHPGRLAIEGRLTADVAEHLRELGHGVELWPDATWLAGGVCAVAASHTARQLAGAGDFRRPSYVVGW